MTDTTAAEIAAPTPPPAAVEPVTQGEKPVDVAPSPVAETAPGETPAPRDRTQERIKKLVSDKSALIEYGEVHRKRAEELEARLKALEPPAPAVAPVSAQPPELADYDHDADKWAKAYAVWTQKQIAAAKAEAVAELRRERVQETQQQAAARVAREYEQRLDRAKSRIPDYDDVVGVIPEERDWVCTPQMAETIYQSDLGPEIAYHLAKHPEQSTRIASLSPVRQAAELGKLEAALMTSPAPAPKAQPKVTSAPEPLSPLAGTGGTAEPDLNRMSWEEFCAARWAQEKASGKR